MLKILINGYGKMGKILEETVKTYDDIEIVGICRNTDDLRKSADFDVLIDFSVPDAIYNIARYCTEKQKPAVLAVTGYSPEQEKIIEELSKKVPVFRAENLSIGINIMKKLIKTVSETLGWNAEIIEKHHDQKRDAPSGTSLLLAEIINESIPIHSIRLGNIAGEHSIVFCQGDEILEIRHTALSKKVFAEGAVKAARFIVSAGKGIYNMNNIL